VVSFSLKTVAQMLASLVTMSWAWTKNIGMTLVPGICPII